MTRLVGYDDRPPFLWYVDLDSRRVEPAAELSRIPQGIDEIVPLDEAVALRCGPDWFALAPDLSGEFEPLSPLAVTSALQARAMSKCGMTSTEGLPRG